MNTHLLSDELHRLVESEPELRLGVDEVTEAGARRRRVRRLGTASAVIAVSGVVAATATLVATQASTPRDRLRVVPPLAPQSTVVEHPAGGPISQKVMQIVLDNSPQGWTYDLRQGNRPNDDGVDGTVDDGNGKGRFSASVTLQPANLTVHPCGDPEFAAKGTCTETPLGDGRTLVQRSTPAGSEVASFTAGVVHADGTGVYAESLNAWWPHMDDAASGQVLTPEMKAEMARPEITRTGPTYSAAQLVSIVEALDSALLG